MCATCMQEALGLMSTLACADSTDSWLGVIAGSRREDAEPCWCSHCWQTTQAMTAVVAVLTTDARGTKACTSTRPPYRRRVLWHTASIGFALARGLTKAPLRSTPCRVAGE